MIKIHDNKKTFLYNNMFMILSLNSSFRIKGWEDRDDIVKNMIYILRRFKKIQKFII